MRISGACCSYCIPPSLGGIQLTDLSNFPEQPQPDEDRQSAVFQQFDLDKHELGAARIDDIVRAAARPVVWPAGDQPGVARPVRLDQAQRSRGHRHDDIVVFVDVMAGLRARGEAPFGHPHPRVLPTANHNRGAAQWGRQQECYMET